MRRLATCGLAIVALFAAVGGSADRAAAQGIGCQTATPYPGDAAPPAAIAAWMAGGAVATALPGELPVMAALTESGLQNLAYGDADSVGYFQMRLSIWNTGVYAGYPTNPPLQLQWFTDQANAVRATAVAGGNPAYGADPLTWGEWIADVERPAAEYRGRYQQQLATAQSLVIQGCGGTLPGGLPIAAPDTTPPVLELTGDRRQNVIHQQGIRLQVLCPVEACVTRGHVTITGAGRTFRITSTTRHLARGQRAPVMLKIGPQVQRALRRTRSPAVRTLVDLRAADVAGNATTAHRAITAVRRG